MKAMLARNSKLLSEIREILRSQLKTLREESESDAESSREVILDGLVRFLEGDP